VDDGSYDVVVVDATADDAGKEVVLELTVLDGRHKGDLVRVRALGLGRDPIQLLGLPGTLVVEDGNPRVSLDE
jgi:hypothetical protein